MANRVNININIRDLTRRGLQSARASLNRFATAVRQVPNQVRVAILVRGPSTARLNRIRQTLNRWAGRAVTVPVRVATRGMLRSVRGAFRTMGGLVSGLLSDGVAQGILGGFRAAGPAGMVILAAIIAGSAALIGAALAGVLVLGFGAAFVGIAGFMASKSEEVRRHWSRATDQMKEDFAGAGEALEPVLIHGIDLMERLGRSFAPHFKQAMEASAPALKTFLDSLDRGIRAFGKRAFEPMMEGFNNFILAFGPEFESFMEGLGDAFGNLGRTATRHSGELAIALRMVLGLITTMIDIINFLANAWAIGLRLMTAGTGYLIKGLGMVLDTFLGVVDGMLAGLQTVAGLLGLDGPIKRARRNLGNFRESAREQMAAAGKAAIDWGAQMDRANKIRQVRVNIDQLRAKLKQAREDLQRTSNKKARAKIEANIAQLTRELARARAKLDNLNGKTATTYVNTVYTSTAIGGHPTQRRRAHGGAIGAAATGGVRANMTLVGEQGPEIVSLAPGSHVRSNPDTRRMLAQGGGGGVATILIDSAGSRMDDLLVEIIRKAARNRGGDDPFTIKVRS